MNKINSTVAVVIGLLIGALLGSTLWYRMQFHNTQDLLQLTRDQIKNQTAEAENTLSRLTAERDAKQLAIDNAYKSQEKKDAQAQADIDRLTVEFRDSSVRVRIECPSGKSGSSATNKASTSTNNRTGNASQTYGVLPKANTGRLAIALSEIEQLSAAYNSCRSTLSVNQHMP